jgi:hypothetical protein
VPADRPLSPPLVVACPVTPARSSAALTRSSLSKRRCGKTTSTRSSSRRCPDESKWLRRDLIRRVEGLGLPVAAIVPGGRKVSVEDVDFIGTACRRTEPVGRPRLREAAAKHHQSRPGACRDAALHGHGRAFARRRAGRDPGRPSHRGTRDSPAPVWLSARCRAKQLSARQPKDGARALDPIG